MLCAVGVEESKSIVTRNPMDHTQRGISLECFSVSLIQNKPLKRNQALCS